MSSFDTAKAKLAGKAPPYPLTDLPQSVADPLWDKIETRYELGLAEVGALKNYMLQRVVQQQQQQHGKLRCCF
jgi:hypothetical protein